MLVVLVGLGLGVGRIRVEGPRSSEEPALMNILGFSVAFWLRELAWGAFRGRDVVSGCSPQDMRKGSGSSKKVFRQ